MPQPMPHSPLDILILSNGPGELATWVRPVVQALRQRLGEDRAQVRISLVLSPCPNASGREGAIAQQYAEIDRIQGADGFWPFLLGGRTVENWDWRDRGLVIFLGGDQIFPVVIGRRMGYRTVTYAEWEVRWPRWIDRFGVRRAEAIAAVPEPYRAKCRVVGDLMVEAKAARLLPKPETELIGLLAGSKAAKLTQGVPFLLIVAEQLHRQRPQAHCFIPLAPSLAPEDLLRYAQPQHNPMVTRLGSPAVTLEQPGFGPNQGSAYLQTAQGARIELYRPFPAYDRLAQCDLCLTTVGANTAELAALAVPMVVLLPTQQLDAMRAWNGIPGLLANLPGLGSLFAKLINGYMLRQLGLLAWPNIWAGEMIVPELVGALEPGAIASQTIAYLEHPEVLKQMRQQLQAVCGEAGAAAKLVELAMELLTEADELKPN